MARFVLEQLSDFRDYISGGDLHEILTQGRCDERTGSDLSDLRISPDGQHIHVILRKPPGLVTCDKYDKPKLALSQKKQDLCITRTVPIVDVFYLASNNNDSALIAVIYETGKAEFWKFQQESNPGWHLVQTSDLCNSPRAKIVSVCASSNSIIWCEERPPSESSPVLSSTRNNLRYCVCRRDFELDERAVVLRGVKIALHNNPKFNVVSSGEYVHLLPDSKIKTLSVINKILISWCPRRDSFRLISTCKSTPLKEDVLSTKESDFKRLLTDCLSFLSIQEPPEICCYSSTGCGDLLLLLSTGWVCILQKDGTLHQVYKLDDHFVEKNPSHTSLCLYQETLALLTEQSLHLIDIGCGTEHGRVKTKHAGLLFRNQTRTCTPHFVSEEGIFLIRCETETKDVHSKVKFCGSSKFENIQPGALLIEAVFEEACTYYQQRSLSSARLTVDALKKGGRFQAPISLASILGTYLSSGWRHKGAQNGVENGDNSVTGQDKLMSSLEPDLKALVALEEVKCRLVKGSVKEVEVICDSLVEKEVSRLLSSPELDKESLLYLNTIFKTFPCQSWRAVQVTLQLHHNGEGRLCSDAPHEIWKTVLSPAPSSPGGKICAIGENKSNFNGNHISNAKFNSPSVPAVLPVFELLCHSVFLYEPSWFPSFLELSQQQQGSAGLALSLASSSWGFSCVSEADSSDCSVPLYKRALSVVSSISTDREHNQELEVELLLVSGRPSAILQAMRILMGKQQWDRVTQVAQKFSKQSPVLNMEIFSTLLCEVAQHRELDPYLELLWSLCPEDITVTNILTMVLQSLPSPKTSSSSFPLTSAETSAPAPFSDPQSSQLTMGLLKPLLRKVLEREAKSNQGYVDILQSPSYPPPTPPRQAMENIEAGPSWSSDQDLSSTDPLKQHNQPPSPNMSKYLQ